MSTFDHNELEERLLRLLATAEDPKRAFEESPLAQDAEAQALFAQFLQTSTNMDSLGSAEREELAEAAGLKGVPGEDRVLETIQDLSNGFSDSEPLGPKPGRHWLLPILGAAAVLVVLLLGVRALTGQPERDNLLLGGNPAPGKLMPSGEVTEWGEFRWPQAPGAQAWYLLKITNKNGSVLVEQRCETNRWTPPQEPSPLDGVQELQWSIETRDAGTGAPRLEHWSASAWLSAQD